MNEEKLGKIAGFTLCLIFVLFGVLLLACIFTGCATTKTNDTDVIGGNSRVLGRLEATVEGLDATTTSSRKRISDVVETSRNIEDGIERLEYLFECYEREVEFLQREIDRIRDEIETPGQDDSGGGDIACPVRTGADFAGGAETEIRSGTALLAKPDSMRREIVR